MVEIPIDMVVVVVDTGHLVDTENLVDIEYLMDIAHWADTEHLVNMTDQVDNNCNSDIEGLNIDLFIILKLNI